MNEIFAEDVVVGSGPTGWAASMGVWSRGGKPLVVDIGYTTAMRGSESVIENPMVKPKTQFGSEHMYSYPLSELHVQLPTGTVPLSGALGGLSTVWGAGIQPVSVIDLAGVPSEVGREWLSASESLLKNMSVLGRDDLLSQRDPWPVRPHDEVVLSPRFKKILARADSKLVAGRQEVCYGSPRLAIVGNKNQDIKAACTLCGQCMSGCPENSIFDSGREIEIGISQFGGAYIRGIVEKIVIDDLSIGAPIQRVHIDILQADGSKRRITTGRLHLAAGPIGTPILLQRSGLAPSVLKVRDSQMFYEAFLSTDRYHASKLFMTTSQGYFSTTANVMREDEFSMSVYEYSDDFKIRLEQMIPNPLQKLFSFVSPLTRYIIPGIGFLSQDVSGSMLLTYDGSSTQISFQLNSNTQGAIRRCKKLLGGTSRRIGLFILPNPFSTPSVGAGFHAGASMPMGDSAEHLVNWAGKLKVLEAVRIVDATSLMRIKAGSHTFMAMANAYRIASTIDNH